VYNHTNEADDEFPFLTSFRGIDNLVSFKPRISGGIPAWHLFGKDGGFELASTKVYKKSLKVQCD
jgi:hypothetical protein